MPEVKPVSFDHLEVVEGALAKAVGLEFLAPDSSSSRRWSSSVRIASTVRSTESSLGHVVGGRPDRDMLDHRGSRR